MINISQGFSIVLCTYNGKSRLEPTLAHIAALQIPANNSVELVFVDNASTDDTAAFATAFWKELGAPFSLRIISEVRPGKGYAMEAGYDAAQYSHILTVDDDNWLQADYLITAVELLELDPAIGVLQGNSTGVMEAQPPTWFEDVKHYFIIGGPKEQNGFFPENDFSVWGAGMVITKSDWLELRRLGFSALTSKVPGKAAGEDVEVALGLVVLGRRIYYSDRLRFKHYMPKERICWKKLQQNLDTIAYVNYYFSLYRSIVINYRKQSSITDATLAADYTTLCYRYVKRFSLKHHLHYYFRPRKYLYQLQLKQFYGMLQWYWKLRPNAKADIETISTWFLPLLKQNNKFNWFI